MDKNRDRIGSQRSIPVLGYPECLVERGWIGIAAGRSMVDPLGTVDRSG